MYRVDQRVEGGTNTPNLCHCCRHGVRDLTLEARSSPKAGEKPGVLVCDRSCDDLYCFRNDVTVIFIVFSFVTSIHIQYVFMDDLMIDTARVHTTGRMIKVVPVCRSMYVFLFVEDLTSLTYTVT